MAKAVKDVVVPEDGNKDRTFTAPDLPYRPRDPKRYRPQIGIIGCGGIAASHLQAYRAAGYGIVHLCDRNLKRAEQRRDEYFPKAKISTDYAQILRRGDIEVVDIATHPLDRVRIIEDALRARKHVLSQKPFVLDLATGERLAALARVSGVTLAVNQNGRWAPHLSYMRETVRAGLIGEVLGIHAQVHWDHTWTKGTPFEEINDLILYDFGIHWFDLVSSLIPGRTIRRVYASKAKASGQTIKAPMLAQVLIAFDGGQASLVFDGHTLYGPLDATYVAGSAGSLSSTGPSLNYQTVQLFTKDGVARPELTGAWFPDGFHGTMGELLCAIEEEREPLNSARGNLRSLALTFAAIASANDGRPFEMGEATRLWAPGGG